MFRCLLARCFVFGRLMIGNLVLVLVPFLSLVGCSFMYFHICFCSYDLIITLCILRPQMTVKLSVVETKSIQLQCDRNHCRSVACAICARVGRYSTQRSYCSRCTTTSVSRRYGCQEQRQLQDNYLQINNRSRAVESALLSLSNEKKTNFSLPIPALCKYFVVLLYCFTFFKDSDFDQRVQSN